MSAKVSSAMRAQTASLVRSRLQAVSRPRSAAPEKEPAAQRPYGRIGFQTARNLRPLVEGAASAWRWVCAKRQAQQSSKRLRVVETVSLGEKRFAAVLCIDGAQFLIGGGANNVSLLASLESGGRTTHFAEVLAQQTAQQAEIVR